MPVDYQKGKIYKIECLETNRVYIGSTCQPTVASRLKGHVKDNKKYKQGKSHYITSFDILDTGNYQCLLICNFPCNSKDELTAHEAIWIKKYMTDNDYVCVNKCMPGRTKKQWREDNKDSLNQKNKQYREDNKESINQKQKQYRDNNKDKPQTKHVCQCGIMFTNTKYHKSRHEKSKKHQDYQEALKQQQ
jgi:hypothetical protein